MGGSALLGGYPLLSCKNESYILFVIPHWNTTPPHFTLPVIEEEISAVVVFNHSQEGVLLTAGCWKFNPNMPEDNIYVADINKPHNYCAGWEQWQMAELNAIIDVKPLPDKLLIDDVEIYIDKKSLSFVKTIQRGEDGEDDYICYFGTNIVIDENEKSCDLIYGSISELSLKSASKYWSDETKHTTIYLLDECIQGNSNNQFKIFEQKKHRGKPRRFGNINPALDLRFN